MGSKKLYTYPQKWLIATVWTNLPISGNSRGISEKSQIDEKTRQNCSCYQPAAKCGLGDRPCSVIFPQLFPFASWTCRPIPHLSTSITHGFPLHRYNHYHLCCCDKHNPPLTPPTQPHFKNCSWLFSRCPSRAKTKSICHTSCRTGSGANSSPLDRTATFRLSY